MARRRKKSGSGGGVGAFLVLLLIGFLASVPKAIWIAIGVTCAVGFVLYLIFKPKKPTAPTAAPSASGRPASASRGAPARVSREMNRSVVQPSTSVPASPTALAPAPAPIPALSPAAAPAPAMTPAPAPAPTLGGAATPSRAHDERRPTTSTTWPFPSAETFPILPPAPRPSRDVPVHAAAAVASPVFTLPPAPVAYGPGRWVPAGQTVEVAGIRVPGGLIYVGTSLPGSNGAPHPCLIDPSKSVAAAGDYTLRQLDYWPSYSNIPSTARTAYLNWLAGGRKDPAADIAYVFLFFYGLERRAIYEPQVDPAAEIEWHDLSTELRRLLAIYGPGSDAFNNYGERLLNWVELAGRPDRVYERPVPEFARSYEIPLYVRFALGQAAVDGAPIPASLALAWAKFDPNVYLRTPAIRCEPEFDSLFREKYAAMHGAGFVIPKNRTKLKVLYAPASRGFQSGELMLTVKDIPDVTILSGPLTKLKAVVEAATEPLDSFSRLLGKDASARDTLEGLLLLPASLWPAKAQEAIQALRLSMDDGAVGLRFQELLSSLGAKGTFTRDKALGLAQALETAGIGFEPDLLAGARMPKLDDVVVLFEQSVEAVSREDAPYLAAALTLQLASAVAASDGTFGVEEMTHLRKVIPGWTHLAPGQMRRLQAHLKLLGRAPASLPALTKKFEPLDAALKQTIGTLMAAVAQADGEVSPAEVKMLEKVYKALGIDSAKVFSDVHAAASGVAIAAPRSANPGSGFQLDHARIAALQQDTDKVSAMLANIFNDTEEAPTAAIPPAPIVVEESAPTDAPTPPAGLLGLDESHSVLARKLLSRPEWTREELLDIAADLDLMLDGALEQINEAAFDAHDMPFFEGEDPLTINTEFLEKVEA